MKMIDGDAAVWMLRKHSMYEAAELIKNMPALHVSRWSPIEQTISDFLTSGADTMEVKTAGYKTPVGCYQTYREHLRRRNITACYVYMDQKRVYLARVPRRGADATNPANRP